MSPVAAFGHVFVIESRWGPFISCREKYGQVYERTLKGISLRDNPRKRVRTYML